MVSEVQTPQVFLQDLNFVVSWMAPYLKIWGSLTNLEGKNFFYINFQFHEDLCTSGYEK